MNEFRTSSPERMSSPTDISTPGAPGASRFLSENVFRNEEDKRNLLDLRKAVAESRAPGTDTTPIRHEGPKPTTEKTVVEENTVPLDLRKLQALASIQNGDYDPWRKEVALVGAYSDFKAANPNGAHKGDPEVRRQDSVVSRLLNRARGLL